MFGRYSKMDIYFTGIVLGIHGTFSQMFFHGSTDRFTCPVEQQQTFRQLSVIQPFGIQQIGNHRLIIAGSDQCRDIFIFICQANGIQCIIKSETGNLAEEFLFKITGRHIVRG